MPCCACSMDYAFWDHINDPDTGFNGSADFSLQYVEPFFVIYIEDLAIDELPLQNPLGPSAELDSDSLPCWLSNYYG